MAYLECADGFCMSVINAEYDSSYGVGSDEDTVEIGRLSSVEEDLKPYAELYPDYDDNGDEIKRDFTNTEYCQCIYPHVPRELASSIIAKHGGLTFTGEAFYPLGALRAYLNE